MNHGHYGWSQARAVLNTSVMSQLAADVTMTTANTYYDGPAVTLLPGTWLLSGTITIVPTVAGSSTLAAQLWDGTATGHIASAQHVSGGTGFPVAFSLSGLVSPTTPTTYKMSAASVSNGGAIKAAIPFNGVGNNASTLVAVPIRVS